MKNKPFKKILSVFLAVLMVMSAWVFVPGEHNHAEAASANNIESTNQNKLTELNGLDFGTGFTTTSGNFQGDNATTMANRGYYKNTLYSPHFPASNNNLTNNDAGVYFGTLGGTADGARVWYPETTLIWDGVTTPEIPILFDIDSNNNNRVGVKNVYISSGANGLAFRDSYWTAKSECGKDTNYYTHFTFDWIMQNNSGNYWISTSSGNDKESMCSSKGYWDIYGTYLRYTGGKFGSGSTYYKAIKPTWVCRTGSNYTGTTRNTIYVIDYVPLKEALAAVQGIKNSIISDPAKYTTASVNAFVEAAKKLVAAKPNNYINSGKNDVTGWNSAVSDALSAWNSAKNLAVQTYTLTFKSQNGTTKDYTYNYGTSITPSSLAPANSITQGDDNGHQTYVWDVANMSLTSLVDDVTINEVADQKVPHNFDKSGNGSVGKEDYTQGDTTHSLTCTVCGYEKTQDHVEDSGTVTGQDTCTAAGTRTYNCAICGKEAIDSEPVDEIKGHDFSGDYVIETDGKDGTHHIKCIRFDECGTYGTSIPHDWDANKDGKVDIDDATVTTAPGCLSDGVRTYYCQTEGCTATYTETIGATGHKTVKKTSEKNVANICGGHGYSAFWTCSDCGKIYKNEALTEEISKYEYTEVDGVQVPTELVVNGPDHDFSGAYESVSGGADGKHHRQCVRFTQCQTYGPEEAHKYTSTTVDSTCTSQGRTTYTCSDCKQSYYEDLPLAAHTMTKHDRVEPACNVPGNIEYYSCSVCNKNYDDANGTNVVTNTTIAALTHTWTAHHDYDTLNTAATCMAAAVYNNHCDYCKVQLNATHSYGLPDTVNGHKFNGEIKKDEGGTHSYKCTVEGCEEYGNATTCTYKVTADVASTCKTAGHTTYECETCGNGYSDTKLIDLSNHTGEGTEIKDGYAATCSSDGYTGDTYCLGCNAKIADGETIPADKTKYPHEAMTDYAAKEATCQEEGYKAYRYCANCGTYEIEKVTVAKKAHKFTNYISNNNGTHTAACDTCDAAVATPETDTKDCSGGTANCVDKKVCTVCKTAYGEVDSNNHKTVKTIDMIPATCQNEGQEAYRYCEACDTSLEEIKKIDKLHHKFGAWSKVEGEDKHTRSCSTCDAGVAAVATEAENCSGGTAYCNAKAKCATCKSEYGAFASENHATQAWHIDETTVKAATCQAEGFTGNKLYDCCNALKEAGTATAKLDHIYDIEVQDSRVAATCIATGTVTFKCSTCVEEGEVKAETNVITLPIDKDNHASEETVKVNEKAASCTEDGYTGDIYHKCCYVEGADDATNRKALISKGSVIEANGEHIYGTDVIPEYMIAEIVENKDEDGKVTSREIVLKTEEPDYAGKVAARRADGKWYHAQLCSECYSIKYTACYTYEHSYNCIDTDICEICEGLCSLVDPAKHEEIETVEAVASTCIAEGRKAYYKCNDCNKEFLDKVGKTELAKDEDGKYTYAELVIGMTSHKYSETGTEKVDNNGKKYTEYPCKTVGCTAVKKVYDDVISGCQHEWSTEYKVTDAPDCETSGYEALYCTLCDTVKEGSYRIVPALGHNFDMNGDGVVDEKDGEITIEPTCTVAGERTYYCGYKYVDELTGDAMLKCDHTYTEVVPASEHDWNEGEVTTEPTCGADGVKTLTCKNCPETTTEAVPATGEHNPGEWTVVKNATCCDKGMKKAVCEACGKTYTEEIPATGEHSWKTAPGKAPTCSEDGYTNYKVCEYCGAESEKTVVSADESYHKDYNGDGLCDECDSDLQGEITPHNCDCSCHKESGISKFIYKIILFFWKLFKISKTCPCGAVHY